MPRFKQLGVPAVAGRRTGDAVSVPDIAAEYGRWPKLATAMIELGYVSLHAIPMRLHDRTLGALTLLSRPAGRLPEDDAHLAQALADSATLALMHWSTEPTRSDDVVTRVQSVIASKAILDIAKGMIAEHTGVAIAEAARLLSLYAMHHHVRLTDTASALVTRSMEPAAILEGQPQQ